MQIKCLSWANWGHNLIFSQTLSKFPVKKTQPGRNKCPFYFLSQNTLNFFGLASQGLSQGFRKFSGKAIKLKNAPLLHKHEKFKNCNTLFSFQSLVFFLVSVNIFSNFLFNLFSLGFVDFS